MDVGSMIVVGAVLLVAGAWLLYYTAKLLYLFLRDSIK